MSRLTNDMETINMVLTDSVTRLISGVMMLAWLSPQSCLAQPYLAAVSMITIPLMMLTFTLGRQTHAQGLPRAAVLTGRTQRADRRDCHRAARH